ncbi:hypothetical protein KKG22_03585 [Patescibacteria group bacterium]|nr:hypothetical protein [Patescibacteria group bacterium]MBU1721231.1 hypothetical protein [Patescibacteria group bacterium]MBU1901061.1 hypothetical protein [Patescibacteria group bacterium]
MEQPCIDQLIEYLTYYGCTVCDPYVFHGYLSFYSCIDIPEYKKNFWVGHPVKRLNILEAVLKLRIYGWLIHVY